MLIRSAYGYDREEVSRETALRCEDGTRTQQHQRDEADINTIVRRFGLTGQLPSGVRAPSYGDFSGVDDYRSALDALRAAEDSFMKMPAATRKRFDNDPQAFVEFCSLESNREEMIKLGLIPPPVVATIAPAGNGPA